MGESAAGTVGVTGHRYGRSIHVYMVAVLKIGIWSNPVGTLEILRDKDTGGD